MSYSKEDLVRYRIERAREAFADTEYLVAESRWNAAANRMYYTCFYVVSAYLALKNLVLPLVYRCHSKVEILV